jgi:tetratricopeptide (TPR) repeat protein
MKTLLIALSTFTLSLAQAATIEQIDTATNQMDLQQLAMYAAENPADYNKAYANYRLSIMAGLQGQNDQAEQALDLAQATLEQMTATQPQAESLALLSGVYGMQIGNNPLMGALYGPKADKAIKKAAELEPENPRVVLVKAIAAYNTPAAFGGSKQGTIELSSKAIELYAQPCQQMCWGHAEAYTWRGLAKQELGDKAGAIADWNKAVTLEPSYGWAKFLLTQQQSYSQNRE